MMPFLGRELLVSLRDRRQFGSLAMLMVIASVVMTVTWAIIERQAREVNTVLLSRSIFIGMAWVQLIVGGLTGFRSAATIARERERETWDLLIATPVRPLRLMLEKTGSYVIGLLLMFVSLIPILALCFLLGGLGPDEVLGAYAIIFVCTLVSTVIGVACSAWCRTETSASKLCALAHFVYIVLMPFLIYFGMLLVASILAHYENVDSFVWEFQEQFWEFYGVFLTTISPIAALSFLFFTQGKIPLQQKSVVAIPSNISSIWLSPAFVYAVLSSALIILLLTVTYLRLRRSWRDQSPIASNHKRKQNSVLSFNSVFSDRGNIVKERELLTVKRSRWGRWWVRLILTVIAVGLMFSLFYRPLFYNNSRECWIFLQYGIYIVGSFFAVTVASGVFTRERAQNTWDLLATTLLTPKAIVHGKLGFAVRVAATSILMLVSVSVLVAGMKSRNIYQFMQQRPPLVSFAILMLGVWALQIACGVFFSIRAESTTRAQSRATAVALMHAAAPMLVMLVIMWSAVLLSDRHFLEQKSEFLIGYLSLFSPLMLMMERGSFNIRWLNANWELCQAVHGIVVLLLAGWVVRVSIGRLRAEMFIQNAEAESFADDTNAP